MATLTQTTLAAAVAATDTTIKVASATGFADGLWFQVDEEFMQVAKGYTSNGGGVYIPVSSRGANGTVQTAHQSGATVQLATGGLTGSNFATPPATTVVAYGLSARRRKKLSYSASGAITLPTAGEDMVAVLNGTSVLAMTVAAPTTDNDGDRLTIIANGAAAHTVTFTGGLSGASTSYDVVTFNGSGPVAIEAMACNGLWNAIVNVPMAGTVTNITATIA